MAAWRGGNVAIRTDEVVLQHWFRLSSPECMEPADQTTIEQLLKAGILYFSFVFAVWVCAWNFPRTMGRTARRREKSRTDADAHYAPGHDCGGSEDGSASGRSVSTACSTGYRRRWKVEQRNDFFTASAASNCTSAAHLPRYFPKSNSGRQPRTIAPIRIAIPIRFQPLDPSGIAPTP